MLSEFLVYLRLGFEHITDPGGLDHILFVAVLTATDVDRPRHLFWLVNTGLEVGQLVIVATLVPVALLLIRTGGFRRAAWTLGVSGTAAVAAGLMVIERI